MPTVAIAHTEERNRSFEHVLALVREAIHHIGGIESFVKPGQKVSILASDTAACWSKEACTADPFVIAALIRLLQDAGAASVQVLEANGAAADASEREVPEGKVLHRAALPTALLDCDVVIAVPKARTDFKDLISSTMDAVASVTRGVRHALEGGDETRSEALADLMAVVRPDLTVTDALICGEGDGPLANSPRWCGCMLAGVDPVAMDVAMASLLGLDPKKLRAAAAAEERGLGSRAPIVYLGTSVERVSFRAWPAREGFSHLPVRVCIGRGVARYGAPGHVKSALDLLLRQGALERAIRDHGTPTILIGDVEDPEFERHIEEGPYLAFGDAVRHQYKSHRRVFFVPGDPAMEDVLPQLMRGLGLIREHARKRTVSASAASVAALAAGVILGAGAIMRRG